ncbi:MAG: hypothetical protein L6V93_19155 [Clostridiales bacterium]|nr:MAG: hypothetical protein L6V93_19155 [Clostridiales bacterium]
MEAQFEGQTKTKLGNSEVRSVVEYAIGEHLTNFLEENPSVTRAILDKALTASRAREAARKSTRGDEKISARNKHTPRKAYRLHCERPDEKPKFISSRVIRRAVRRKKRT